MSDWRATAPDAAERVACIGTGLIGTGWVAHFLRRGLDVAIWDANADAMDRAADAMAALWPRLETLGLAPGASLDRLVQAPSLETAVAGAPFVQESGPERLELKQALLEPIAGCRKRSGARRCR